MNRMLDFLTKYYPVTLAECLIVALVGWVILLAITHGA